MKKAVLSGSLSKNLYVGVDVGGTKIQASLISSFGTVLGSTRRVTPREVSVDRTIEAIEEAIGDLLATQGKTSRDLQGIGIAVPGVVQPENGYIVVTPNMNLSGVELGPRMKDRFQVPVTIGNDCNLGTLGECWLGSGRDADSCVGIFIGTGIGAGIVFEQRILSGAGQSAGEIGHVVSQLPCESWQNVLQQTFANKKTDKKTNKKRPDKGSKRSVLDAPPEPMICCGCGNYGCFETLASRTAIERNIREAVQNGYPSIITELCGENLDVIKSGALSKALKASDELVIAAIQYAAQVIGYTCLTVRHLLDPEVIILGGGVIEACQKYMMPTINAVVAHDQLPVAPGNRRIVVSSLGDNAVVLGAVALAKSQDGVKTFKHLGLAAPKYPRLRMLTDNVIHVAEQAYSADFIILPDGTIELRGRAPKKSPHGFRMKDLWAATQDGVDLIILASSHAGALVLSEKCQQYLSRLGIEYKILPLAEAVELYNSASSRRSCVFHFA